MLTHYSSTSNDLIETMRLEIHSLQSVIEKMRRNPFLGMLNQAGLMHTIDTLPADRLYTIVFCDMDTMKALNAATGAHQKTDDYLRAGFTVRAGEVAAQIRGDELCFILDEPCDAQGFERRMGQQLRAQRLGVEERRVMLTSGARPYISATFAHMRGVRPSEMRDALHTLSIDVLAEKAGRDARA